MVIRKGDARGGFAWVDGVGLGLWVKRDGWSRIDGFWVGWAIAVRCLGVVRDSELGRVRSEVCATALGIGWRGEWREGGRDVKEGGREWMGERKGGKTR